MDLNENTVGAAGGVLAGLAAAWLAFRAWVRGIRDRGEWKGRMEARMDEHTVAIQRLEHKMDEGFKGLYEHMGVQPSTSTLTGARAPATRTRTRTEG